MAAKYNRRHSYFIKKSYIFPPVWEQAPARNFGYSK
jgi:hypothetical protein